MEKPKKLKALEKQIAELKEALGVCCEGSKSRIKQEISYLNNLYEETPTTVFPLTMESTVNAILDDICNTLFSEDLKGEWMMMF